MMQPLIGRADLHMHTTASDGKPTVRELLQFVADHRPELDVIAITDHDRLDSTLWAYEHRGRYPFDIVPGVEVTSRAGHVLALWVTRPIPPQMSLSDTVAAIHEAGGLAILAHPFHLQLADARRHMFRYWRRPAVLPDAGVDAIEAHNAGNITPGCNMIAGIMAKKSGLAVTGSSDAHTLGAIGSGVTRFPGRTAAELRTALQRSETVAEGKLWPMLDYVEYLKNERQRRATNSLVSTTSSPTTHTWNTPPSNGSPY